MALIVLALVVRIAAAVLSFGTPLPFDAKDFDRHARSIATGHGYPEAVHPRGGPSALRPPAFPAILGAAYSLRGGVHAPPGWRTVFSVGYVPDPAQVNIGRIVQALIGWVTALLVGLIATQLWGRRVGLVALGIAAIYPPLIVLGTTLLSDPLFVMFELASVAAALRSRVAGTRSLRWAIAAGLLAGLAWLTRSNGYVLLVPLALLVWTRRPRRRALAALAPPAALVAAAVLVVSPWTIRNAEVMHAFVPVSDNGGYTLAGTYNPSGREAAFRGGWRPAQLDPTYGRLARASAGELELSRVLGRAARHFIGAHPLYVGEVGFCNTLRLAFIGWLACGDDHRVWAGYVGEEGTSRGVAYLAIIGFAAVALLAFAGAVTRLARETPRALWLVPVAVWTTVFVLAASRFRAPLEPFLIMLAALALVTGAERLRGGGRRARERLA